MAPQPQTLERRLPLVIGGFLLAVIIALSTAAYVEVRHSAVAAASARLLGITTQFRDLFQASGTQLRTHILTAAAKAEVARYARTGKGAEALKYEGPSPEQVIATDLRDSVGAPIYPIAHARSVKADLAALVARHDSATIGRFQWEGDSIVYPMMARVPGTSAYLVRWRKLSGSRRQREQIAKLIGSEGSIYLGNPGDARFTDLERPVPAPPLEAKANPGVQAYSRGGNSYLAAAAPIPGTPWLLAVDFPLKQIMAPVRAFMWRIALIGFVALAIGLLAAWTLRKRIAAAELQKQILETEVAERTRELKDAQEQIVRRERLAMLGQLSSGVGHELRNPLGVMTNAVYFLKTVLGPQAAPTVREYLDIISQQISLSEKIVSDLLDFARQKAPQRKPTSVADVAATQVSRLGATNGVRVMAELPEDLPDVMVDQIQMGQIVFNLLTNAVQAVEGKGAVTLRAEAANGAVKVDVADTGPGVSKENLEKIFEPLFTTKARGIGLGLAVSRTLARANGGDITVASEPGHGARFTLTLQRA